MCFVSGLAQQIAPRVPPRRSLQLSDGFGMNIDLPREPRLPWTRRWWTRLFDSGVKWVRIGQYENSAEKTNWDWVEQTRGVYTVDPEVDEAIRSLVENHVNIEIELQYSNPLYESNSTTRPHHVFLPPPGIGQNDSPPNPIFIPPATEEQIAAFLRYVRFMVRRYKGTVSHWELWNEPDIGYWQPQAHTPQELVSKARAYGRVLAGFANAVHEANPKAKVIFGGTASPDLLFTKTALTECHCASKVDIVAYHSYPGFGHNHPPEEADTVLHAAYFREQIMHIVGMRNDTLFWDNEWNVSPLWAGSNQTVQARYVPRFYLYNLAQHVRGFMWVFIPSTDGNEDDLYGLLNGETLKPDAFQPREAFRSFDVASALFGETRVDPMAEFNLEGVPDQYLHGQVQAYGFRDEVSGKRIYAFWLAVVCNASDRFKPLEVELHVSDPQLRRPILIDVRTGKVARLNWKRQGLLDVPLKDSVMAVADASYLDWPNLPATPGQLQATKKGGRVMLQWSIYGKPSPTEIDRSVDYGSWRRVTQIGPGITKFFTTPPMHSNHITYRVRLVGPHGASAWSNPAWVRFKQ
jgi:hypothetical protein